MTEHATEETGWRTLGAHMAQATPTPIREPRHWLDTVLSFVAVAAVVAMTAYTWVKVS